MNAAVRQEVAKLKLWKALPELEAAGESPYKANRKCIYAFDVDGDVKKGMTQLAIMEDGIDVWIEQLEALAQKADEAASSIARLC